MFLRTTLYSTQTISNVVIRVDSSANYYRWLWGGRHCTGSNNTGANGSNELLEHLLPGVVRRLHVRVDQPVPILLRCNRVSPFGCVRLQSAMFGPCPSLWHCNVVSFFCSPQAVIPCPTSNFVVPALLWSRISVSLLVFVFRIAHLTL